MTPIKVQKVFLSYRRADTKAFAERLYDRLVDRFGKPHVFKDVDSLEPGTDFRTQLKEALEQCHTLVAVIGEGWAPAGGGRLDDPSDFVRIEIEAALARQIPILPVLADPALMPRADDLPPSLQPLAFRQAVLIRSDPDFHRDVEILIRAIERHRPADSVATSAPGSSAMDPAHGLPSRPLKRHAVLDRRLATEIVVLFSQRSLVPSDPRLVRLLQFGLALYDQLLVENQYGSTLFQVVSKEPEILKDSLSILHRLKRPEEDRDFAEMAADAADVWANDPQLQLEVARYERKKGGGLGAVEENLAYLQDALQLAQRFDAALLPHPDRWPLFRWLFEHSLGSAGAPARRASITRLPAEPTDPDLQVPPEREHRVRSLAARLPAPMDPPLALIRYGPMPYPFPPGLLRRYEEDDLARYPPFLYEFCAPSPSTGGGGAA